LELRGNKTDGEHLMKMKLSALLSGLVVLSGVGIAQAADVVQKNTQSKAASAPIVVENTQSKTAFSPTVVANPQKSKTGEAQTHGPIALTDDQMSGVTAGHYWYQGYLHLGDYTPDGVWWYYGWHY
jgi:hypothetical protein